jgi:succinate dehydrogenase hydrophobic anchor subunit
MKKLILLLALCASCAARAQSTNAPLTYFEAYSAVADAPLVKGMSSIGILNNQITYPVEVRAERLTNLQTTNTLYAVSLRTRVAARQLLVDYIDYDELDGIIRGIQWISQADHSASPMDNFEAIYRTRCGLTVYKVSNGGKYTIVMKSGDPAVGRNQMAPFVLDDLGRYLTAAKAKIDSVAASGQ